MILIRWSSAMLLLWCPSFQMTLLLHTVCIYSNCAKPSKTGLSSSSRKPSRFWISICFFFKNLRRGIDTVLVRQDLLNRFIWRRVSNFPKIPYTVTEKSGLFGG